ncbi:hypothetical protein DMENIID0001_134030 [Sergentomyia squamirostris]
MLGEICFGDFFFHLRIVKSLGGVVTVPLVSVVRSRGIRALAIVRAEPSPPSVGLSLDTALHTVTGDPEEQSVD